MNKQLFELLSDNNIKLIKLNNITINESNNIFLCNIDKTFNKDIVLTNSNYHHINNYYFDILNLVNSMDFMICGRFHSHIFSIICNKPFISLSCSRKCIELMNEYDLNDFIYKYKTNDIIIPIDFNHLDFYNWFKNINEYQIKNKINNIHNLIYNKLDDMINIWNDLYDFINN